MKRTGLAYLVGVACLSAGISGCVKDAPRRYTGDAVVDGLVVQVRTTEAGYELLMRNPDTNAEFTAVDKSTNSAFDPEVIYNYVPAGDKLEAYMSTSKIKEAFKAATKRYEVKEEPEISIKD